ncbi:MAG: DUF3343 domain-containing protein [Candidatus Margulisbacteria bacterium]|nr:DUF3343 domain-containing protein [Candidatus Margulisiibacteriota bacterium]
MKILLFDTIYHLLKTEKELKEQGVKYEIIPTPREYSSNCGSAIRILEPENELLGSKILRNRDVQSQVPRIIDCRE